MANKKLNQLSDLNATPAAGDYLLIRDISDTTDSATGTDKRVDMEDLLAANPTISSGSGVPATTPSKVGDIYVDTSNSNAYVATGTASSSDWEQIDGGAGSGAGSDWELWSDTTYTTSSRLTVTGGVRTKLPNNGGSSIQTYGPSGVDFYNGTTQKITPQTAGEAYLLRINFQAEPQAANTYYTLDVDIGGGVGIILERSSSFAKGSGVAQGISLTSSIYALSTFISNGGEVYITPNNNTEIWDVSYLITRVATADVDLPDAASDGTDYVRNNGAWANITPEFADNSFRVQDNSDATKEIAFEASGITTATTRTITMPDNDVDLGDLAQCFNFTIAVSDEVTYLSAGTAKVTFPWPYSNKTLTRVRASVNSAPTGSALTVDINDDGVSILSSVLSIAATTTSDTETSFSGATPAKDSVMTIDIDAVGSTLAGKGLKIQFDFD